MDIFYLAGLMYLCCKVYDIWAELRHIRIAVEDISDDCGEDDDNATG